MQNNRDVRVSLTSDSSDSVGEVTNVESNVFTLLKGARALAGPSSQPPLVPDSENKIRKNFRKSIIKRAVHPYIVSSTPFHSEKSGNRNSFENISTISDIGSDNISLEKNRSLAVIEEHGSDENQQKEKSQPRGVDRSNDREGNKSLDNTSRNTSLKVDFLKDLSLKSIEDPNNSTRSRKDGSNQTRSEKNATKQGSSETSKHNVLEEILEQSVSKANVNKSVRAEKSIVHNNSKEMHIDDPLEEDDFPEWNLQRKSKIIVAHTTTDDEQIPETVPTSKTADKVVESSEMEIEVEYNHSKPEGASLKSRLVQNKTTMNQSRKINVSESINIESSDVEIHSKSQRNKSVTRSRQDKRKLVEEFQEISPSKRKKTLENRRTSMSRSRSRKSHIDYIGTEDSEDVSDSNVEFENTVHKENKSKLYRKKKYHNKENVQLNEENRNIRHEQETIKSTKRKKFMSDEESHTLKTKKLLRKPGGRKNIESEYSSNEEETELSEELKIRGKNILRDSRRSQTRRTTYLSDKGRERDEKIHKRGKKRVWKRGRSKYFDRGDYPSLEESNEERRRNKTKLGKSRISRKKDYSSDEDDTEFIEVHKVRDKNMQKRWTSRNSNKKIYAENERDEGYKKKGKRVPQEVVRVISKKRVYSPEESEDKTTRRTLQKRGRSKAKTYYSSYSSSDDNQTVIQKKIILKGQRSKSLRRKEYNPEKSSNYYEELSYTSDTHEDVRKARYSKKVMYVVDRDSTVSDVGSQKIIEERHRPISLKKFKYVDEYDRKQLKRMKDPKAEIKSKRRTNRFISDESSTEEEYPRKTQHVRQPSTYKTKGLDTVRPSCSKQLAIMQNMDESSSPQKNSPLKRHGRLSRRDSYILEQKTRGKKARSILQFTDQSSLKVPDINDENFVTPVNQRIPVPQTGMTTKIRGIVDQQLAKYNETKRNPAIDDTIKETRKTPDRIVTKPVAREEIEDIEIPTDEAPVKNSNENNVFNAMIGRLLGNNAADDNSYEGHRSESSEFSNGISVSSMQETIRGMNFAKQGDLDKFGISRRLSIRQKLARRSCKDAELHTSLSRLIRNRKAYKPKKRLCNVIDFLTSKSTEKSRNITDVSVQTSLPGLSTDVVGEQPENNVEEVPQETENVPLSTVKYSRIPVYCKKRTLRTISNTQEDEPPDMLPEEEDIPPATVPEASIDQAAEVSTRSKKSTTSDNRQEDSDEIEATETLVQQIEENPQINTAELSPSEDTSIAVPDDSPRLSRRRTRRFTLNSKGFDGRETKATENIQNVEDQDSSSELPMRNNRRTQRYTLNSKEAEEGFVVKSGVSENSKRSASNTKRDDGGDLDLPSNMLEKARRRTQRYMLDSEESEETEKEPISAQTVSEKNRRRTRRSTIHTKQDHTVEIEPIDLIAQEEEFSSRTRTSLHSGGIEERRMELRDDDEDVSRRKPRENSERRKTERSPMATKDDDHEMVPRNSIPQENVYITSDQDEPAIKPAEVTPKSKRRTGRSTSNNKDVGTETEQRDLLPQKNIVIISDEVVRIGKPATPKSKPRKGRSSSNTKEVESETEQLDLVQDNIEIALDDDISVIEPNEVRRKSKRSTLHTKEDWHEKESRGIVSVDITSNEPVSVKNPEEVSYPNKKKIERSTSSTKDDGNEMEQADSALGASSQTIDDQNVSFVKPVGVAPKSKRRTQRLSKSREETTDDDGTETSDSKTSGSGKTNLLYDNVLVKGKPDKKRGRGRPKKKETTKSSVESTDDEVSGLRRSAREKKTMDPFWWSAIVGPPTRSYEEQIKSKPGTSLSPKRRKGGQRNKAMQDEDDAQSNEVDKKELEIRCKPKTSKRNIQEKKSRSKQRNESDNDLDLDVITETPTNNKITQDKKSTSKRNKGNVEKLTDGGNEASAEDTEQEPNNVKETPSTSITSSKKKRRKQRITMQEKKPASDKKKENRKLIYEENEKNQTVSNALERFNATEIESEGLTEIDNTVQDYMIQQESRRVSSSDPDGLSTATSHVDKWYLMEEVKKTIGQQSTESYMIGDNYGYFALAPGQKSYRVNKKYEMVYIRLEGAISLIMEQVLYPEVPDIFIIPKGVPACLENTGVGRALFFFDLR